MKVFKLLIFLIILALPFGEIIRLSPGNDIYIKPLDILVIIVAITYSVTLIKKYKQISNTYLTKPLFLFSVLALFSLLINSIFLTQNQLFTSFLYLLRWISCAMIFFVVLGLDDRIKKRIPILLLVSGTVVLLLGFIQYFLYGDLRNLYYLGWDEHNYRLFSVFLDPNFAGAFFVLFGLLLSGLTYSCLQKKEHRKSSVLGIFLIITIIAIFLTYSRSAILMLIAAGAAFLILINKKHLIFYLFGTLGIALLLLLPTFNKENTNPLRITSSLARVETYSNAIKVINDKPFFGVGFNAYRYAQQSYGFRNPNTQFPSHADAGADSSLLFVTATTGIIGLVAYLYLWLKILQRAYYLYSKKANIFALVVFSSTIGLFFNSLFINSLFFPVIMLWMWILIGLMESG